MVPGPMSREAFLRNTDGPVAYFGCSRFGWCNPESPAVDTSRGGPSLEYAYNFYDQLFAHNRTDLGRSTIPTSPSMRLAGNNNSDRWLQFGLNYQGDPALLAEAS
jgi:hypothetical protein